MPTPAKKSVTKKTTAKRVPAASKKTAKPTPKTAKKPSAPAAKSSATKRSSSRAGTTAEKKSPAAAARKKVSSAKKAAVPAPAENPSAGLALAKRCVAALEEKKASAIEVIFLGEKSPVADYFVIATGTSDPHLRALRVELEKAIREVVPAGHVRVQNEPNSGWCVVDAFDVVVHIFSEEQRRNYALEELWNAGERVAPEALR